MIIWSSVLWISFLRIASQVINLMGQSSESDIYSPECSRLKSLISCVARQVLLSTNRKDPRDYRRQHGSKGSAIVHQRTHQSRPRLLKPALRHKLCAFCFLRRVQTIKNIESRSTEWFKSTIYKQCSSLVHISACPAQMRLRKAKTCVSFDDLGSWQWVKQTFFSAAERSFHSRAAKEDASETFMPLKSPDC